jgi:hypothetical protein
VRGDRFDPPTTNRLWTCERADALADGSLIHMTSSTSPPTAPSASTPRMMPPTTPPTTETKVRAARQMLHTVDASSGGADLDRDDREKGDQPREEQE